MVKWRQKSAFMPWMQHHRRWLHTSRSRFGNGARLYKRYRDYTSACNKIVRRTCLSLCSGILFIRIWTYLFILFLLFDVFLHSQEYFIYTTALSIKEGGYWTHRCRSDVPQVGAGLTYGQRGTQHELDELAAAVPGPMCKTALAMWRALNYHSSQHYSHCVAMVITWINGPHNNTVRAWVFTCISNMRLASV